MRMTAHRGGGRTKWAPSGATSTRHSSIERIPVSCFRDRPVQPLRHLSGAMVSNMLEPTCTTCETSRVWRDDRGSRRREPERLTGVRLGIATVFGEVRLIEARAARPKEALACALVLWLTTSLK